MLSNCICRVNSSIRDDIPLLQRRAWSVGSFELLAFGYIFSCGNALGAEQNWDMDCKMDCS
ncbi:hypothetical protein ACOSQ2_030360 [Xanthoceras sorbifolium]